MKMVPVNSSNVEAVGYDPANREMHVRFKGSSTYVHHNVGPDEHAAFVKSPSLGKHYHANFKDKFGVHKA